MPVRDEQATDVLPAGAPAAALEGDGGEALIGRSLGKFTIVEHLGRGGSGDVYRAEQPQLGRSAVIKVLRREVAGAGNRIDRFLREARLASKLDHPYAAHVYAFGAEGDGLLWIAMEHVRGATLDAVTEDRGSMPPAVFAPLFVRLCEVVHTAHELGIVHRDAGADVVEIVHECLAERWPRLARWRSEDAADRALYADVRAAARRWQDGAGRPDLLWRGEALAELRRLAARSTALTAGERAFFEASERAERRSRRARRILRVAANRNRTLAEQSAETARASAALAEERLTASLVAQGRRELNDGRALAALAYLGEAMRRGADGTGLRFMVAAAMRGWPHEKLVARGITAFAVTPSAIVASDRQGKLHLWTPAGAPLGELATELGEIAHVRHRGERMLAIGQRGAALVDPASRRVVARFPLKPAPMLGIPGPGADEITLVMEKPIDVLGPDGKPRRSLAIDMSESDAEPVFGDPRHMFLALGTTVQVIDLAAMTMRALGQKTHAGPMASADGGTIAWLDPDRRAHVVSGDGTPVATFKPANHPAALTISDDGARIGAIADHALAVFDRTGKELRSLPTSSDELQIHLRGDEVWTGSTHGVIRRYERGLLVASLPGHTSEIVELRLGGELAVSWGTDGTLVGVRADARHLRVDPEPCEGSYMMTGPVVVHFCDEGRTIVYAGRRRLGEVTDRNVTAAAIDPRSQRSAVASAAITVFDPVAARLAATREHVGPLAFEDGDRLLVLAGADDPAGRALWRFTIGSGAWQRVADVPEGASALAVAAGGIFIGTDRGQVLLLRDGHEVRRTDAGERVEYLTTSVDGLWVAAQLSGGGTLLLDGRSAELTRRLEPADSVGMAATLDAAGELVIRPHRGTLTVWDRATGDNLVYGLDLLRIGNSAAFSSDGRIELVGRRIGLLDVPRETRPVAELLRDLDCRVPLRVAGGRLEVSAPECGRSR